MIERVIKKDLGTLLIQAIRKSNMALAYGILKENPSIDAWTLSQIYIHERRLYNILAEMKGKLNESL